MEDRVSRSKRACVDAAQQTARLLHNIKDKKSLIFDFPWWQMISCLICASSILLVARILMQHEQTGGDERIDWENVEEDADLCLQVFDVLSTNSKAARLARDMMEGLKETRSKVHMHSGSQNVASVPLASSNGEFTIDHSDSSCTGVYNLNDQDLSGEDMEFTTGISEPLIWSSQFVDAAYNPFLGYSSITP